MRLSPFTYSSYILPWGRKWSSSGSPTFVYCLKRCQVSSCRIPSYLHCLTRQQGSSCESLTFVYCINRWQGSSCGSPTCLYCLKRQQGSSYGSSSFVYRFNRWQGSSWESPTYLTVKLNILLVSRVSCISVRMYFIVFMLAILDRMYALIFTSLRKTRSVLINLAPCEDIL